jgi:hypothetical protein
MIYEFRLKVDPESQTITVTDSDGISEEIAGYLLVVGGEKCYVTSYGEIEAIAEGFANAYGTAKTGSEPFAKKLLTLLNKCIQYASMVNRQFLGRSEITSKEALEKFEATCECREGECKCRGKKTSFH